LLTVDGPPDFRAIEPVHIAPAIESLLADARAALARAAGPDIPADHVSLAAALDVHVERLGAAWNAVSHLHAVVDTPALRASYLACLPQVTAFYTALNGGPGPYRNKRRFAEIAERRALLTQRFATNVLDATDRYALYVGVADMDGLPEDVVKAFRKAAAAHRREGCKLNLRQATYGAVMRFATNRTQRETMYRAYVTRASEFGPRELDNTDVMRELLELRHKAADLLGMANHAEVSLAPNMARDPQQVTDFLYGLATPARMAATEDIAQLRTFAHRTLNLDALEAWDLAFAWDAFAEAGVLHQGTRDRFRREVLEVGGSRPAAENPSRRLCCASVASWPKTRSLQTLDPGDLTTIPQLVDRPGFSVIGMIRHLELPNRQKLSATKVLQQCIPSLCKSHFLSPVHHGGNT
jgi:oligopeptidase A